MIRAIMILTVVIISFNAAGGVIHISNLKESFTERVKVSGAFFMGLQFNSNEDIEKLYILFPSSSTGMLCVEISSIDGRYKAYIEQKLVEPVSGLTELAFQSRYRDKLNEYKPSELAVKAVITDSCDNGESSLLLASWRISNEKNNPVILIRSDARKDIVYVPGVNKSFKCKRFVDEYKVAYDKYCELIGVDLTRIERLVIQRKNLRKIPDEFIKLAY